MKIVARAFLFLFLSTAATALAQKNYADGPVWRVVRVHVLPGKANEYWADLNTNAKKIWEAEKAQGMIVDYKIFLATALDGPQSWDVSYALEFKNMAAIDGFTAKFETLADEVAGGAEARQQLLNKRAQTSQVVSSELIREVTLK